MKKIKRRLVDNKGITLIEVVLAMAISAILLIILGTIANTHLHTYRDGDRETEAQFQAQVTMDFILEKLRTSAGLNCENTSYNTGLKIGETGSNKNIANISDKIQPDKLTYYTIEAKNIANINLPTYTRHLQTGTENTFSYDGIRVSYAGNEVSSYIKEFYISPLPSNKTYSQCDGLSIEFLVAVGNAEICLEGKTYFRNKK